MLFVRGVGMSRKLGNLPLLLHHLLVRRQRDQREVLAVEVVHQVEDAREAGAGVPGFVPGAVFFLGLENIGDSLCDGFAASIVGCKQSHDRPRGL